MTCFVGVDIGLDGGVAMIPPDGPPQVVKMPTFEVSTSTKRKKREVDFDALRRVFVALQVRYPEVFVMIERAQLRAAMTKVAKVCPVCATESEEWQVNQGVASQANFIGQWREFRGLLRGLAIAFEDIHPATWKANVFHGQPERGKDAARSKASTLYPEIAVKFKHKNSDGLAEALLLAWYAKKRHGSPF